MDATRAAWEVTAGVIPGEPMSEYTRRFVLNSEEFYGEDGFTNQAGFDKMLDLQGSALMHAVHLMNPNHLNWVRLEWIWF